MFSVTFFKAELNQIESNCNKGQRCSLSKLQASVSLNSFSSFDILS